jgi:glutamate formiminotransferase
VQQNPKRILLEALVDTATYYLGLENFSVQRALEARFME